MGQTDGRIALFRHTPLGRGHNNDNCFVTIHRCKPSVSTKALNMALQLLGIQVGLEVKTCNDY